MSPNSRAASSRSGSTINPSLVIGLAIAGAVLFVVLCAAMYRLCRRNRSFFPNTETIFNPNRPRNEEQTKRIRQVRKINNMYAAERGRVAMRGEFRNLRGDDEESWSIAGTSRRHEQSIVNGQYGYNKGVYYKNKNDGNRSLQINNIGRNPRAIQGYQSQHKQARFDRQYQNVGFEGYSDDEDTLTEPFPLLPQFPIFSNPLLMSYDQDSHLCQLHPHVEQAHRLNLPLPPAIVAYPPQAHSRAEAQLEFPIRYNNAEPQTNSMPYQYPTYQSEQNSLLIPPTILATTPASTSTSGRPKITINDSIDDMNRTPALTPTQPQSPILLQLPKLDSFSGLRYYENHPLVADPADEGSREREAYLREEGDDEEEEWQEDDGHGEVFGEGGETMKLLSEEVEEYVPRI